LYDGEGREDSIGNESILTNSQRIGLEDCDGVLAPIHRIKNFL
jgi:hypothetical protein